MTPNPHTRYALFEGRIHDGQTAAFRAAVLAEVVPHWNAFPGVLAVRVCFENERDDGAPQCGASAPAAFAASAFSPGGQNTATLTVLPVPEGIIVEPRTT